MIAANYGHLEYIKLLLSLGAKADLPSQNKSALILACTHKTLQNKSEQKEIVSILVEAGADVNKSDLLKQTPLLLAATNASPETLKILVNNGAKLTKNISGETALMQAADYLNHLNIPILIEAGCDVNEATKYGGTALIRATSVANEYYRKEKLIETIKALIYFGANVNAQTKGGLTALMYVCMKSKLVESGGYVESVKLLLEAGADPNLKTNNNNTALYFAREAHFTDVEKKGIIEALTIHGATE